MTEVVGAPFIDAGDPAPHMCTECLAFVLEGVPMELGMVSGVVVVRTYCPECDALDSLVELATVRA